MPRKPTILSNEYPYHITLRCNNKEKFHCSMNEVWQIFCVELLQVQTLFDICIHAFVLMPNHIHLLVSTPHGNISEVMQSFIASVTREINLKSGRTGRVFGGRYHSSLITTEHYYDCVLKYVYRNPVKAQIVESVEAYEFSTLRSVLGLYMSPFKIEPPKGHIDNIPDQQPIPFLRWLNQAFKTEQYDVIRHAIQKSVFRPMNKEWKRKEYSLESFRSFVR